jgi:DNA-binding CsgD family transcriptional regulator
MNAELSDFMTNLLASSSTEKAGQTFIRFAQRAGACVVHTFFGTAPEKQSVSTLPAAYTQEEGRAALRQRNHIVEPVRAGVPRNFWGLDFEHLAVAPTEVGTRTIHARFEDFRQRSSVTFSMPNADNTYSGAGVGIGFEDSGKQLLTRFEHSGGIFAVAAHAAYSHMLRFETKPNDPSPLSPRQAEILQLLASGHRLGDIADMLTISDSAVNLYLSNLRAKLGVRTKEQALAMAIRSGWIEP